MMLTRLHPALVVAITTLLIAGALPAAAQIPPPLPPNSSGTAPFHLSGWAEPRLAKPGEPVGFHLMVTNTGDSTATFIVDGCPVHYTLDGIYTPQWACAEFARLISLEPGGSIAFDPGNDPQLLHHPQDYFLTPGMHAARLWIPGVGGTEVHFAVEDGSPPPPDLYPIDGSVFALSAIPEGLPIAGATVLAVPVVYTITDTLPPPYEPGAEGAADPALPPDLERGLAFTGPDGRFHMDLHPGTYRLIAGRGGQHRYQYWDHVEGAGEATCIVLPDPAMGSTLPRLAPRFDLAPLDPTLQAAITGTVLAMDPFNDGPPQPLAGAEVFARPILPDPHPDLPPLQAVTDSTGRYALRVPADTPYMVSVSKQDYGPQFFGGAFRPESASWVDVAPGRTTGGIDFILQPLPGPDPMGAIEGWVYLVDGPCADGSQSCLVPAAGAVVRVSAAYPTFAPYERRAIVGRDGRFFVDGLTASPDGSLAYYVSAELPGFASAYYPGGVPFDEAMPLSVFPGDLASAGRIHLGDRTLPPEDGFVTGIVSDGAGTPIPRALVRAFLDPETPAGTVVRGVTDAEGRFHLNGLPAGVPVLLSAEAEGFVPAYYPGVHRWTAAERVWTGGPAIRLAPVRMMLRAAVTGGPHIQAGRVRIAIPPVGEDSSDASGGDPDAEGDPLGGLASARVQNLVMAWHRENLPGAFFYLVDTRPMVAVEIPVAGGSSSDNGTLVLTDLPAGRYIAFADRPGFRSAYFSLDPEGGPTAIRLDERNPAVLAEIRLEPLGAAPPPGEDADSGRTVSYLGNAPNPFRPQTTIAYRLERDCSVTLRVFDYQGRLVRTLAEGELHGAGLHEKTWDGCDDRGRRASAGVYFYRITAKGHEEARRMVLLP